MKVGFIFLHPFSGSLGSTVRVREIAISLHKFGVNCFILSPYEKDRKICEGVNVVSIGGEMRKLGLSNYLYKVARLAYYNRFFVRCFMSNKKLQVKFAKRLAVAIAKALEKMEVGVVQAEQDVALPVAIEVKKKTGLPLLADLHNITTEELVAAGVIRRGSDEFDALQLALGENLKLVDSVVVVSEEMKNYVAKNYGISSERIIVVPPGGRPRLGIEKKNLPLKVVYSGLVEYREHVDLFVRSMPMVQEKLKATEFYITRKGEALKEVEKLAEDLKVNPTFFWYPDEGTFYEFLSSCHIGVLPSSNDLARKMGTPVKLFDYLSAGLPVVANDVGAWTDIIREENVGIVTADDPASFASGILELAENKELLEEYIRRGLELVRDKFSWDNSAKILFNEYKKFSI